MLPLAPPLRLHAIELRGELAGGLTRPVLAIAQDDNDLEFQVVLKARVPDMKEGHMGATSLASELICSVLGRALGLRVPDYAIVTVSPEFVDPIENPRVKGLLAANLGDNFGSIYHEGYVLWNPEDQAHIERALDTLEDVITFDSSVINGDRRREKPNLLWNGSEFLAIDHSLALPMGLWPDKDVAESPLFPEPLLRKHVAFKALQNRGRAYLELLARWDITDAVITELRSFIPATWETKAGDLDKMLGFLAARHQKRSLEITQHLVGVLR